MARAGGFIAGAGRRSGAGAFGVEASAGGVSRVGSFHAGSSERDFVQQTGDGADLVRGGGVFYLGGGEGDLTRGGWIWI